MSTRFEGLRRLAGKQDVILNAICLLFAVVFLLLAAANLSWSGDFLTIDSLFVTTVFALLALVFLASPLWWAHEHGYIRSFLAAEDELTARKDAEPVHFEGSVKLFGAVLGGLLVLTIVEVVLAYFHVPLALMLTILIGLSVIKAGLIMAYFMHLKFERQSLVMALIPALVVCICLLFIFFPDGFRLRRTRPATQTPAPAAHETQPTH
jgi:cytochrome c oxidase subunit 4